MLHAIPVSHSKLVLQPQQPLVGSAMPRYSASAGGGVILNVGTYAHQSIGRWRSDSYCRYIRPPEQELANISRVLSSKP